MDCREFRVRHVGFVDDTLPAVEMQEMQEHLRTCARCSRHDTVVRRGLLIVRNLPQIQPSPDFMAKLNARLAGLRMRDSRLEVRRSFRFASGAFAALAAGLALIGYLALEAVNRLSRPVEVRLPPVVATAPAPEAPQSLLENPAFVASFSAGMPVWSGVLMADQAPQHLTNAELREAALR
jgi:hypothetical protein